MQSQIVRFTWWGRLGWMKFVWRHTTGEWNLVDLSNFKSGLKSGPGNSNIVRKFPKLSLSSRHVTQERWKKVLYLRHAISVLTQWQTHETRSTNCPAFPTLTMHSHRNDMIRNLKGWDNLEYPCIKETTILKRILKNEGYGMRTELSWLMI